MVACSGCNRNRKAVHIICPFPGMFACHEHTEGWRRRGYRVITIEDWLRKICPPEPHPLHSECVWPYGRFSSREEYEGWIRSDPSEDAKYYDLVLRAEAERVENEL